MSLTNEEGALADKPQHSSRPEAAEAYLRLLKGEISSEQYVAAVRRSVRQDSPGRTVIERLVKRGRAAG